MRRIFLVFVALVAAVAWWLNDPLPERFSQPWKLRTMHATNKARTHLVSMLNMAGLIQSEENFTRSLAKVPAVNFTEGVLVRDEMFEDIPVRVYRYDKEANTVKIRPGMVYFHGGGFVYLSPPFFDRLMSDVMADLDIVVVSVDYRLAPEHKFPAAFEDCLKATKYVFNNAKALGIDPNRVAIAGDSSGGNLAAAVALKLRDDQFSPMPRHQILLYPVLQGVDMSLPSYVQYANGFLLTRAMMASFISNYAVGSQKYTQAMKENLHVTPKEKKLIQSRVIKHGDLAEKYRYKPYVKPDSTQGDPEVWEDLKNVISNPYFSPLMADDLKGLPEAYIFTAQYDVLRDEGLLYVKRLRDAGITVTHVHGEHNIHGACTMKRFFFVEGQECVASFINYLKKL